MHEIKITRNEFPVIFLFICGWKNVSCQNAFFLRFVFIVIKLLNKIFCNNLFEGEKNSSFECIFKVSWHWIPFQLTKEIYNVQKKFKNWFKKTHVSSTWRGIIKEFFSVIIEGAKNANNHIKIHESMQIFQKFLQFSLFYVQVLKAWFRPHSKLFPIFSQFSFAIVFWNSLQVSMRYFSSRSLATQNTNENHRICLLSHFSFSCIQSWWMRNHIVPIKFRPLS